MTSIQIPGYLLIRKLAEGGCAEVYEGLDQETHRKVAIKILSSRHLGNKTEYKRVLKEGALGLRMRHHENLVQTLKVSRSGDYPYIVLEFLTGQTMREVLRESQKLNNENVVRIAGALARALRYMHGSAMLHKDLKPDNVMLGEGGMVKLIDFGFSEAQAGFSIDNLFGRVLDGSPAYMAPELLRTKKATQATDLYALGCTLYEAASGRVPFGGTSDAEIMGKQLNMDLRPDPLAQLNSNLTIFTQKLIMNALEKKPEQRYKSVDEFLLELSRNPVVSGSEKKIAIPGGWTQRR